MAAPKNNSRNSKNESSRLDLRAELDKLESSLKDLKVQYEQYFSSLLPLPPDALHASVKRAIRQLRKAPFKSSALAYRLKNIEVRYSTWNTYWQRVLKEKEEGTYFKDVFKANLRDKIAAEEAHAHTAQGVADKNVRGLFDAYRSALDKQGGKSSDLDFNSFKDNIMKRAQEFKAKHADKKLSFKIVVKDGRVVVQAKAKD